MDTTHDRFFAGICRNILHKVMHIKLNMFSIQAPGKGYLNGEEQCI